MAGVNETKNGNIARSTKLQSLTGYNKTNRNKYNMGAYREVENNMILAQNELDEAYTALNDAKSNYMKASLTHTQLLSSAKSYEITMNSGKNVYDRMVTQSQHNLLKLGKIYKAAEDNFNNAEDKFINAKDKFINAKNKFNKFKQNSKKSPSSSWFSLGRGGRKTHKRHHYKHRPNKRNKTKRNRN